MSVIQKGRLKIRFDGASVRIQLGSESANFYLYEFVDLVTECLVRIVRGRDDSSRKEGLSLEERRNVAKRAVQRFKRRGKYVE